MGLDPVAIFYREKWCRSVLREEAARQNMYKVADELHKKKKAAEKQ